MSRPAWWRPARGKLRALVLLALITGARIGELLKLRWDDVTDQELVFWNTKNGKTRRIPLTASILEVLRTVPRVPSHKYVITNVETEEAYTVDGVRCMFDRAVQRAGIVPDEDVTLHTLRHTAISRMIAEGHNDHTVMAISGHSSTRMLERYTHPTEEQKIDALESYSAGRWHKPPQTPNATPVRTKREGETSRFSGHCVGGRHRARTCDLRVAKDKGDTLEDVEKKDD